MSLRKLHKETVCAKETIVLSFPMEKLKEHLTCTGFIFLLPFFYEAQAKQNHTEVYQFCDSVKNDAHLKEDLSMYLCYKGELPCQLNRVGITHLISVFCSEAGESALHRAGRWGGRWSTFPQGLEAGTVESALQSSRLSSQDTCTSFLFCSTPSKLIQSYLVSLCLCKGLFCPKNNTPLPHSLACIQWGKKPEQRKMIGQQKTLLHFTIKRNNAALIFLESFIV